jgi:Na+-driven multidrug efflux pump
VVMTGLTICIIAFSDPLIAAFGVDPASDLGTYAAMWLRILGVGMPLAGIAISFGGLFQGAGATRVPLAINAAAHLLFQVPMSFVLGFPMGLGVWGVWAAFPMSFLIKDVAALWAYLRLPWDKTGATVEG